MSATEAIFDRLKEDHDRHRALLDKLLATHGDSPERESLFEELTKELKSHAAAEEQALYSTMMRKPPTTDETRHSVAEHHEIDELLETLEATEYESPGWLASAKKLQHLVTHHLDEEEQEVFQLAGRALGDSEKTSLAKTYRQEMESREAS